MKQKNGFTKLLALLPMVFAFSCNQHEEEIKDTTDTTNSVVKAATQPQQTPSDKAVLAGNWTRTDAEYRIEISDLSDDGKMKASYFNPKSINVAVARWTNNGGVMKIYIELRDVNYPGSTYNLAYVPGRSMLAGDYFQAVEGTTYKVEFIKAK